MKKIYYITSFALLIIGVFLRLWVISEQNKEKHFIQQKQQKMEQGLAQLDKLIAGDSNALPENFHQTQIFTSDNIEHELAMMNFNSEKLELASSIQIVLLFAGAGLLALSGLYAMVKELIRLFQIFKKFLSLKFKHKELVDSTEELVTQEEIAEQISNEPKQTEDPADDTDWAEYNNRSMVTNLAAQLSVGSQCYNQYDDDKILDSLMTDEDSVKATTPDFENNNMTSIFENSALQSEQPPQQTGTVMLEDSLKAHTEHIEKQLEEFKQISHNATQSTMTTKPLAESFASLSKEMSAIREYASSQQQRVEKLQDGYDWNIIRTFCLRIIRCLDNLESRIADRLAKGEDTHELEDIKDELLFALESSGVEQFQPEINSNYRGQEKFAEAVKQKQSSDDPQQKGLIAQVIRRGYKYFIDDENYKIVRTAQVKLYG